MVLRILLPATLIMLAFAGCEESNPGIMDTFIFQEENNWLELERDWIDDPNELVNFTCCNDTIPKPIMAIDTTIEGVINPAEDLDYYDLQVTDSFAGQLFLETSNTVLTMRLFSRGMEEYQAQLVSSSMMFGEQQILWTMVYGPDSGFTLLVKSSEQEDTGDYTIRWLRAIRTSVVTVDKPQGGESWNRTTLHTIQWTQQGGRAVSLALMKGPAMIEILAENIRFSDEFRWLPTTDLDAGDDYRIIIYDDDNPELMDISNAFELR